MEETAARVTPRGVRDGEPGALLAVRDLRGPAVLAYCELVCAPGRAGEAATETFSQFRAAVASAQNLADLEPDALLISLTRHAAADRAPAPPISQRRVGTRRPGRSPCELISELLVARAEDRLTPADRERLDRHLERCDVCRATAQRFRSAELAYRDPPEQALPEPVAGDILRAMVEAVPVISNNGSGPSLNGPLQDAAAEHDSSMPLSDGPGRSTAPRRSRQIAERWAPDTALTADTAIPARPPVGTGALLGPLTSGGRHLPRRHRPTAAATHADGRRAGFAWRMGLPGAVVLGALLVTLAVAGVFSGSSGKPGSASRPATTALPSQATPAPAAATPAPRPHRRHHRRATTTRHRKVTSTSNAATPSPVPTATPVVTPAPRTPAPVTKQTPTTNQTVTVIQSPPQSSSPSSPAPPASGPGFKPGP